MREALLLAASTLASLALALGVLSIAAPNLFGGPADLRIVQVDERVVPFYEHVLGEPEGDAFVLNDPYTGVRLRPLVSTDDAAVGPTDVLGFRNPGVPNRADVVVIGDSQTHGVNVPWEQSWPGRLARTLAADGRRLYGMAVGGWSAVQYLDMFEKSRVFEPRVAVVAFYSGHDAEESFRLAYAVERWASLRPDPALGLDDRPLLGREQRQRGYASELGERGAFSFTPWRRLHAIRPHPVNDAGWEIMAEAARRMARLARERGTQLVFTIVPTKELTYAGTLARENAVMLPVHVQLVEAERARIATLATELSRLGRYVDLTGPLEQAVAAGIETHPASLQGHPSAAGYARISSTLAPAVRAALMR